MCSSASLFPSSLPHPQEQKTIARDRRRNMEDTFPVIDAEKINCEEGECKKLREACERWGCLRIINHSIPAILMADMKKVVEALHELPMEIKKRNTEDIAGGDYVGPNAFSPLYEALGLYGLCSSQAMHNFCSQLDASPNQRFVSSFPIVRFN